MPFPCIFRANTVRMALLPLMLFAAAMPIGCANPDTSGVNQATKPVDQTPPLNTATPVQAGQGRNPSGGTPESAVSEQPQIPSASGQKPDTESKLSSSVADLFLGRITGRVISEEYDAFFKEANLGAEKEQAVRKILVAYGEKATIASAKGALRNPHTDYDPRTVEEVNNIDREQEKRLAEVLSPEELDRFKEYRRPERARQRHEDRLLEEILPGVPSEKRAKVLGVMQEEMEKNSIGKDFFMTMGDKETMKKVRDGIRSRLSEELTPEQFQTVDTFVALMSRMGDGMRQRKVNGAGADPEHYK